MVITTSKIQKFLKGFANDSIKIKNPKHMPKRIKIKSLKKSADGLSLKLKIAKPKLRKIKRIKPPKFKFKLV